MLTALLLTLTLTQAAPDFTGAWTCDGISVADQPYTLVLTVEPYGHVYRVIWHHEGQVLAYGVGMRTTDQFVVAYAVGQSLGIVAYLVTDGRLEGLWTVSDGKIRPERCRRGDPA